MKLLFPKFFVFFVKSCTFETILVIRSNCVIEKRKVGAAKILLLKKKKKTKIRTWLITFPGADYTSCDYYSPF